MKFFEGVLTLSGMIIGVGMFGIPFSFAYAGFWVGTGELILLTALIIIFHLVYGEIVLRTPQLHRLPGYIKLHLGDRFLPLGYFATFFGVAGTLIAYMLVGSTFLNTVGTPVIGPHSDFFWMTVVGGSVALITFFPLRREAALNSVFTLLLIGFLLYLIVSLFPGLSLFIFGSLNYDFAFLPYGILLFALSGSIAIPDVVTIVGRYRPAARRAILLGTIIPAVLYFLFAFAVVGTTGLHTSPDAISGLGERIGAGAVYLGSAIGFLAVYTSFVVVSSNFQSLLILDVGFSRHASWGIASLTPFILYGAGISDFIRVIDVVGAVAVGIESVLLLMVFHALRGVEGITHSWFSLLWKVSVCGLMGLGVLQSIFGFFS